MTAKHAGSVSPTAIAAVLMSLVAVGVTTSTQSISLSNFTPRIENLPTSCQNVYETAIEGCNKDDFTSSAGCSSKCVQGLLKISKLVTTGCRGVDVPETSIIGVFNLGKGVQALCPGVEVTTISSRPSSTAAAKTTLVPALGSTSQLITISASTTTTAASSSSSSSSSSSAKTSSSAASTTSTPSATSSQQQQQKNSSSSQTTSQLAVNTNTPPPRATQTQQANQNAGAGVGSPFDIGVTAGTSSSTRISPKKLSLAIITMGVMACMLNVGVV